MINPYRFVASRADKIIEAMVNKIILWMEPLLEDGGDTVNKIRATLSNSQIQASHVRMQSW